MLAFKKLLQVWGLKRHVHTLYMAKFAVGCIPNVTCSKTFTAYTERTINKIVYKQNMQVVVCTRSVLSRFMAHRRSACTSAGRYCYRCLQRKRDGGNVVNEVDILYVKFKIGTLFVHVDIVFQRLVVSLRIKRFQKHKYAWSVNSTVDSKS